MARNDANDDEKGFLTGVEGSDKAVEKADASVEHGGSGELEKRAMPKLLTK